MGLILYFLRHGQTALSREDVFCGSGLDPELTPEGMEMAQAFAKAYGEAEWRPSMILRELESFRSRYANKSVHCNLGF